VSTPAELEGGDGAPLSRRRLTVLAADESIVFSLGTRGVSTRAPRARGRGHARAVGARGVPGAPGPWLVAVSPDFPPFLAQNSRRQHARKNSGNWSTSPDDRKNVTCLGRPVTCSRCPRAATRSVSVFLEAWLLRPASHRRPTRGGIPDRRRARTAMALLVRFPATCPGLARGAIVRLLEGWRALREAAWLCWPPEDAATLSRGTPFSEEDVPASVCACRLMLGPRGDHRHAPASINQGPFPLSRPTIQSVLGQGYPALEYNRQSTVDRPMAVAPSSNKYAEQLTYLGQASPDRGQGATPINKGFSRAHRRDSGGGSNSGRLLPARCSFPGSVRTFQNQPANRTGCTQIALSHDGNGLAPLTPVGVAAIRVSNLHCAAQAPNLAAEHLLPAIAAR